MFGVERAEAIGHRAHWRIVLGVPLAFSLLALGCSGDDESSTPPTELDGDVVEAWNGEVVDHIELHTIAPPAAARVLGYTSLAMHEALASGPDVESYAGVVTDLPEPPDADGEVWWPMVVASAAADTAAAMLVSEDSSTRLDALLAEQRGDMEDDASAEVLDRSAGLGEEVAAQIVEWAAQDGYAESADDAFEVTGEVGHWEPTPPTFAPALEPGWGTLRPFVVAPGECELPPPVEYSTDPDSEFYAQAEAVYEMEQELDEEEVAIAEYWNMEPNTGTPAGHWTRILDEVSADLDLDLVEATEATALVTMAMHDAIISGWGAKFETDVLRPVTYIQEHIDPDWLPYLVTPQFPEYPSGHSFISGAASAAATARLGEQSFTNASNHEGEARSFESFEEAALEAADSRYYGGVHYRMGIEGGNELGTCIGELAAERLDADT